MRVLLIRPTYDLKSISPNFPIGLAYLAASLREHGHSPRILDLPLEAQPLEKLRQCLRSDSYPLVGISALTVQYPGARRVVECVRAESPASRIVLGGPHPSVLPEQTLRESGADYIIKGEGEQALVLLADAIEQERTGHDLPAVGFLSGDAVRINPPAPAPPPDAIPMPAYDLLDLRPYFKLHFSEYIRPGSRPMQIFTSRGCPFHCTFCHELFGKRFRAHSSERVLEEIALLHNRYGVDEFLIYDDIFNLDLDRAKEIFRGVLSLGWKVGFSFPNGLRAERMDEELMALMAQAGVHTVTVAVESASERMQRVIRKNLKLPKVPCFLAMAKRHRMRTQAFFIIGFPEETLAEIRQTIRYARGLKDLDYAFFSFATPYPGTELAGRAAAIGLPVELNMNSLDFYVPHVETAEFSYRQLKRLRLKASLYFYLTPSRIRNLVAEFSNPQFARLYLAPVRRMLQLWTWRPSITVASRQLPVSRQSAGGRRQSSQDTKLTITQGTANVES